MTAEIICVGTELLLGDILNTNAQFLSRELAELGISVMHQHVIGDNPARLKELVLQAKSRSDLLVFAGGYVAHQRTYEAISDRLTAVHVPNGQRIEITLPDGSRVWLNSGARIEYPVVFKKNLRSVKLSGEALFDVRHDAECPFEVETFATKINVLGTKFNVIADETYDRFSAALLQGRIKVTNLLDPRRQEIVMKPDDIVNLSNGRLFVETIRDPEALCWTEGLVRISGLPFDELMAKFEQVFDVKIVIARNSIPDIGKISGKIRVNDGIENALHILQYAADFSFEKDEETNVVTIR